MTLTLAATAGLAAGAAVVLTGLGWLVVRRRRPERIASPEEAADAAERALPGFIVAGAVVGADGAGALAVSEGGRVAAIARVGGELAVQEVTWTSLRAGAGGVVVETRRRKLGSVTLAGVNVLDIRRLAPKTT